MGEGHFFFEPHPFFFAELFFVELFLVFFVAVILTPLLVLYLYVH